MNEYWKTSGEIPGFGNWDFQNELPITMYFETARQAGLVHHRSSSRETDPHVHGKHDLYAVEFKKQVPKATRTRDARRYTNGMRKHRKVYNVTECPSKQMIKKKVNDVVCSAHHLSSKQVPKAVDEDLYKISPQLLPTTKRNKILGFISKCLLPCACVS